MKYEVILQFQVVLYSYKVPCLERQQWLRDGCLEIREPSYFVIQQSGDEKSPESLYFLDE